jgi:hypothetical protein
LCRNHLISFIVGNYSYFGYKGADIIEIKHFCGDSSLYFPDENVRLVPSMLLRPLMNSSYFWQCHPLSISFLWKACINLGETKFIEIRSAKLVIAISNSEITSLVNLKLSSPFFYILAVVSTYEALKGVNLYANTLKFGEKAWT